MHETLTFVDLLDTGNAQAHLILLSIARHANWDHGTCWASQETLARMSKCSLRTVRNYLGKLEDDGFISRTERRDERGIKINDEITLLGYADWIKALREGGKVERPREVARYTLPEDLSSGSPANLAGRSPAKLGGVTGKQVAANNELYKNSITTTTKAVVESTQSVKGNDLDTLQTALLEAADACLDNPVNCSGLLNLSIPQIWIGSGCDLEKDILPTLKAIAQRAKGKKIRSWSYFTDAVLEAKSKREAIIETIAKPIENKTSEKLSWVRVEAGTPEYDAWKEFYKSKNNPLAAFMEKTGQAIFVVGREPKEHGDLQLAYLDEQQRRTQDENVERRRNQTAARTPR